MAELNSLYAVVQEIKRDLSTMSSKSAGKRGASSTAKQSLPVRNSAPSEPSSKPRPTGARAEDREGSRQSARVPQEPAIEAPVLRSSAVGRRLALPEPADDEGDAVFGLVCEEGEQLGVGGAAMQSTSVRSLLAQPHRASLAEQAPAGASRVGSSGGSAVGRRGSQGRDGRDTLVERGEDLYGGGASAVGGVESDGAWDVPHGAVQKAPSVSVPKLNLASIIPADVRDSGLGRAEPRDAIAMGARSEWGSGLGPGGSKSDSKGPHGMETASVPSSVPLQVVSKQT